MIRVTSKDTSSAKKKASDFISLIIISLLLILLVLLWQFISLNPRDGQKVTQATSQIKALWQFSIYSYRDKKEKSLNFPYDAAVDSKQNIYVTDSGSGRILKYDQKGEFISSYDGRSERTLHTPLGISINKDGKIAVADKRMSYVAIFDENFKLIRKIPEIFPIKPFFYQDKLFLTTFKHVAVFSISGRLLDKTGSRGKSLSQFDFPNGIAISNNLIYISDSNNHRLKALSEKPLRVQWVEGQPVQSSDDQNRKYDLPAGLASDEDGFIYMIDNFDCSIKLHEPNGRQIAIIGDYGNGEGKFKYPTSITYAGSNRFIIVDRGNSRVQVMDIYASKPGIVNASKNVKASVMVLLGPVVSFSGLIIGIFVLTLFVLSFMKIKDRIDQILNQR